MTSNRLLNRPDRAYRIATAASIAVVAWVLTACGDAQPQQQSTSSPSASTSGATPGATATPAPPTVFGKLTVTIAKTTSASVVPSQPISYRLGVRKSGGDVVTYPIGPDGEFALALETGTYEVAYLEIDAKDLGPAPVNVPLTATELLQLHAPASGCVYGGHVAVLYGRLAAGDEQYQAGIVKKLADAGKQDYRYIYLPSGGIVITGAKIDIPAVADRPEAARDCVVEEFASVPA